MLTYEQISTAREFFEKVQDFCNSIIKGAKFLPLIQPLSNKALEIRTIAWMLHTTFLDEELSLKKEQEG